MSNRAMNWPSTLQASIAFEEDAEESALSPVQNLQLTPRSHGVYRPPKAKHTLTVAAHGFYEIHWIEGVEYRSSCVERGCPI